MPEDAGTPPRPAAKGAAPSGAAAPRARLVGIDAARGFALIGMFIAHAVPDGTGPWADLAFGIATERSRLLFAVTAGLGLGLLTGGVRPAVEQAARWVLRRQIAIRALILLVLGLLLTALGPLLYVILDEYGVAFFLMIPLVFLPARVLMPVGAVLLAAMPALLVWIAAPGVITARGLPPHSGGELADWFVTGSYPVVGWVPIMMIGVGLARLGLDRARVVAWTGAAGVVAFVVGLVGTLAISELGLQDQPSTGVLWLDAVGASLFTVGNVGAALAVVAGLIALTALTAPGVRRVAAAVLSPVAAAGSMPLTVYTVQVVVLWATIRIEAGVPTDDSWATLGWLTLGSLLGAWLWRRFIGRGPLEWLVAVASGRS